MKSRPTHMKTQMFVCEYSIMWATGSSSEFMWGAFGWGLGGGVSSGVSTMEMKKNKAKLNAELLLGHAYNEHGWIKCMAATKI